LIKKKETLIFDWYRKPTFSGRFLNYFSWHPLCQKIGTIIGLIDRVLLLSHPNFHKKNVDLVIKILLNNGYPLSLIFSTIKKRLYKKFDLFNCVDDFIIDKQLTTKEDSKNKKIFCIPFIPNISTKISMLFKNVPFLRMAYRGINKLNRFIKVQKNVLLQSSQSNVIYKIDCKDCDASYVGQTSRCLKTRINEYVTSKLRAHAELRG